MNVRTTFSQLCSVTSPARGRGHPALYALALALLFARPSSAARQAVLVLRPALTAEAVLGPASPFAALLPRAATGVMNTAVVGPRVLASAFLTLGAGSRLAAGPLAEPARFPDEVVEGDPAAVVYERRLGPLPPGVARAHTSSFINTISEGPLLYLGWAAFLNTPQPPQGETSAVGGLARSLGGRGGVAWLGVGHAASTRLGALTAVDQAGTIPRALTILDSVSKSLRLEERVLAALPGSDRFSPITPLPLGHFIASAPLVVLDLPPSFDLHRLSSLLERLAHDPQRDLLLASPYPPPGPAGAWNQLPPILGIGPDFPPGRLTSATTRTLGLVANIDVAPTLLAVLGVPVPTTMSGKPMRSTGPSDPPSVVRFAQQATLAQRAEVSLGLGTGAAAAVVLVLVLLALRESGRGTPLVPAARSALLLASASPLGLLLAPLTGPMTTGGLAMAVLVWTLAGALVAVAWAGRGSSGARRGGRNDGAATHQALFPPSRSMLWLYVLTMLMVAGDLLLGGRLIARSPTSGFAVAGIRFYGIGNEYMGVLVGAGLLAPLVCEDRLARYRWAQAALFLGLLLLIGSPSHGANLGGALTAAAAFTSTLLLAVRPRRPFQTVWLASGAVVAAGTAVLVWDALRPAPLRSHLGDFAQAVWSGGWLAAEPVLRRKAAMNWRLLTSGFALIPILGVAPLLGVWYHGAGRWLSRLLASRPELRAAIGGSLVGAGTSLLWKDSGVIPWMFISLFMLALLLDEHLRQSSP